MLLTRHDGNFMIACTRQCSSHDADDHGAIYGEAQVRTAHITTHVCIYQIHDPIFYVHMRGYVYINMFKVYASVTGIRYEMLMVMRLRFNEILIVKILNTSKSRTTQSQRMRFVERKLSKQAHRTLYNITNM